MPNQLFDLSGRVAIITGGAGLLGREHAGSLADAGAHVVVADIQREAAQRVAAEVTSASGVRALAVPTDISAQSSVTSLVAATLAAFGRIDILVNNAAIDPKFDPQNAGAHMYSFEEYPLELWNQSLQVNLTGMFLCCQAVAESMLRQRQGSIINIASIYGLVGPDQRLYATAEGEQLTYKPIAYSVTKSGVIGFTRYLATYWANRNIRVNTLTLGGVFNQHEDDFVQRYSYRTPLGRMADKSDFRGALQFLASDASAYMTGSNLVIDGGWTAW